MIGSKFLLSTVLLLGSSTIISSLAQERFVPDQLLVKFKPGTPRVLVHEVNTEIGAFIIGTSLGDPDLYLVQVRPGLSLENAINRYQMNPNIVRASKNSLVYIPEDAGDNFGDIAEGSRFFSEGRAYLPWAVGQNARCDLLVRRFGVGPERDVEALFFGRAGDAGSNWSLGSYRNKAFDYLFQPNPGQPWSHNQGWVRLFWKDREDRSGLHWTNRGDDHDLSADGPAIRRGLICGFRGGRSATGRQAAVLAH